MFQWVVSVFVWNLTFKRVQSTSASNSLGANDIVPESKCSKYREMDKNRKNSLIEGCVGGRRVGGRGYLGQRYR